ncbi:MAG: YbaB/EbfC family nucleoid-associated protein [Chloroflexota bacterium]
MGGGGMLRQIEELQNQMAQAQAALGEAVVQGSAGGGAVVVEMTGSQELRAITIKPEVVDPEDVEMLQDLIMSAFKDAVTKAQALTQERMGPLTAGLDIPGLL